MNGNGNGDRVPRGALAVVAVGLVATVAAALLSNTDLTGDAAQLEWVQIKDLEDSKPVPVPGGGGKMRLAEADLRATGTNVSGYSLYRSAAVLKVDAGSPVGSARISCSMSAPGKTEVAQTPGSRASYPRSSDELDDQPVPEVILVQFSSHGTTLAVVEAEDRPDTLATEPGIKAEWPKFREGVERWRWFLPPGPPSETLELPFMTVWKATEIPAIAIACTLKTSAGEATVRTAGALGRRSETIAE